MTNIINNNHHIIPLEQLLGENRPGERNSPRGLTEDDIDSNWNEAIETFDGMRIPEKLLRGIYAFGFEKPSAIQQRAIKPMMLGRDLIAQAQSGTVSLGHKYIYVFGGSCEFIVNHISSQN